MWMSIGLISFMAIPYLVFNVWLVLTDYYLLVRENRVRPSLKKTLLLIIGGLPIALYYGIWKADTNDE